jgi:hypothetical protein
MIFLPRSAAAVLMIKKETPNGGGGLWRHPRRNISGGRRLPDAL